MILVVCAECMFTWYWLADLCARESIPFVLGHALYMRAIHGAKAKNDRIDSKKIAGLLRGGTIPQSYVYPREMRSTRDLLRRRTHFVRKRAELSTHVHSLRSQSEPAGSRGKRLRWKAGRVGVGDGVDDASARKSLEADLRTMDALRRTHP